MGLLFVISIRFVSPEEEHTPILIKLDFKVTNNVAKYEAYIVELQMPLEI